MSSSSTSPKYSKYLSPIRIFLSLTILVNGVVACARPSPKEEKSQSNVKHKYQLLIASDSPTYGFVPSVLATTGEKVYLSTNQADRVVEFDSVIPSIVNTGLHLSIWIPKDGLNRLSRLTKQNVGKRLAFVAFDEVLTAAKIYQPMEFTLGRISVGVPTVESKAIRLLNLFKAEK